MEIALDAGADDVMTDDEGVVEVICPPTAFAAVRDALQAKGLVPDMSDIVMKPNNEIELTGEDAIKMQKLLDALEGLDDVQEVYTNASMDEQGTDA
jgi:transcriptional/translational regulatory protein YebC/TACO1